MLLNSGSPLCSAQLKQLPVTSETGDQLGFYILKYQGVLENNINGQRRQKENLLCDMYLWKQRKTRYRNYSLKIWALDGVMRLQPRQTETQEAEGAGIRTEHMEKSHLKQPSWPQQVTLAAFWHNLPEAMIYHSLIETWGRYKMTRQRKTPQGLFKCGW